MHYISLFAYLFLALFLKDRTDFAEFMVSMCVLFGVYFWQLFKGKKLSENWWKWAIAYRLVFFVSIPLLSDDFYRFIWDGLLVCNGINPYLFLPSELIEGTQNIGSFAIKDLYPYLNSPNYYSVYPPVNQLLFAIPAFLAPKSILAQVIGLRIILWFFEAGAIYLIANKLKSHSAAALFALNPLLIIETSGNLHFEIVIVFFCLLAVHLFLSKPQKGYYAASSAALAVLTKVIPILLVPIAFFKIKGRQSYIFILYFTAFCLIGSSYFWNPDFINKFSESIALFFRTFEFNASFYYLIRYLGFLLVGYNIIAISGVALKAIAAILILIISIRSRDFALGVLLILTIYLLTATTVHPWYLIPLLAISVFTSFRFVMIWSFTVFLSYSAYSESVFNENLWLVGLEYFVVFVFLYFEAKKYMFSGKPKSS